MIRAALLTLPLILAACLGGERSGVAFRDTTAPIWSAAALAPETLAGDWLQVASFASDRATCRAGALTLTPTSGGLRISGSLCLNGKVEKLRGLARETGPGRLTLGGEEWWILWVDSGTRTLAIGTPSGRFGFVLDRGTIPPDRLQAAGEIFDFNGYVAGALRPF